MGGGNSIIVILVLIIIISILAIIIMVIIIMVIIIMVIIIIIIGRDALGARAALLWLSPGLWVVEIVTLAFSHHHSYTLRHHRHGHHHHGHHHHHHNHNLYSPITILLLSGAAAALKCVYLKVWLKFISLLSGHLMIYSVIIIIIMKITITISRNH